MKRAYCKRCNDELHDTGIYTGYCVSCAEKRREGLSKTLVICATVGSVLTISFYLIVYLMQLKSDGTFYGTEPGFKIYKFFVTMDINTLYIICFFLFFLPFGIKLGSSPLNIQKDTEAYPVNNGIFFSAGTGLIYLFKWLGFTVCAPVIIIYMLFHLRRLKRYVTRSKERS